jgi:predicted enzyme related to lactoylglutathione lyase
MVVEGTWAPGARCDIFEGGLRGGESPMAEFVSYPEGTPNWVDLATTDVEGAALFYRRLFGWTTELAPLTRDVTYTMCLLRGRPVAAVFPLDPAAVAAGAPSHWTTCIGTADADDAILRVEKAGGSVVGPPLAGRLGRRVAVQDADGAFFALWEPRSHAGSAWANEPGSFTWNELQTHDIVGAEEFYRDVLDWDVASIPTPTGSSYHVFRRGGRDVAGMMAIDPRWGPVPPHWGVYFAVDDCDAAAGEAHDLGGTIDVKPMPIGESGRISMVRDPQGAHLWLSAGM